VYPIKNPLILILKGYQCYAASLALIDGVKLCGQILESTIKHFYNYIFITGSHAHKFPLKGINQ